MKRLYLLDGHARRMVKLIVLAFAFAQMAAGAVTNYYVATNGPGIAPYTNWAMAASNIQDAINVTLDGDTVLVSNGVYNTGTTDYYGSNRVYISKAITVRSANNDPTNTIIQGTWDPATNGPTAVRCVAMVDGSTLIGFTLTNGATATSGYYTEDGGGISCYNTVVAPAISNCIITCNSAGNGDAGAYYGALYNCQIVGNLGAGASGSTLSNCSIIGNSGSGARGCTLYNCILANNVGWGGGGVDGGTAYNCTIASNTATGYGGGGTYYGTFYNCTIADNNGAYGGGACHGTFYNCRIIGNTNFPGGPVGGGVFDGTLYNCLVVSNYSGNEGGGLEACTAYNCLITGNSANQWGGGGAAGGSTLINCTVVGNSNSWSAGGVIACICLNCIVYSNYPNNFYPYGSGPFTNCCTSPMPDGSNNITNDPMFVNWGSGGGTNIVMGDYHLQQGSPCLDAGDTAYVTTNMPTIDMDGHHRINKLSGLIDMGCYENVFNAGSIFSAF